MRVHAGDGTALAPLGFQFDVATGARQGEHGLERARDAFILRRDADIEPVLSECGVPLASHRAEVLRGAQRRSGMGRSHRYRRPTIGIGLTAISALLLVSAVMTDTSAQPTRPPGASSGPNDMPSPGLAEQPAIQNPAVSPQNAPEQPNAAAGISVAPNSGGTGAAAMLNVPVTTLLPGNVAPPPRPANPVEGQAQALQRGMTYFVSFNCVGCHAPNGGGGMGPSLSNSYFLYGGEPADIYLSIFQGRPNGMPAWGTMLPDSAIWDIVAYISSISKEPSKTWGQTISRDAMSDEQVAAEYGQSTAPWGATQKFSDGQKPNRAK
jgi:cytochrome c oxidase cbb3-type subunit 3